MTDAPPVFDAKLHIEDDATAVLAKLKLVMVEVTSQVHKLAHAQKHVHEESVWARLRESTHEAGEQFDKLGEHVKGVGEHVTELLPQLSALGAVGGVAALFETVEKTSEAYGELAHTAASLGMQAQQLHVWNAVATLTDTNAESMAKSMAKLNRVIGEANSGKNKDALNLFHHMKIDPHKIHDAAEALPLLAAAFHNTASAATRATMANTLLGRGGVEMIPMLMQGRKAVEENLRKAGKLTFNFAGFGEGLEQYNESMKELGLSTHAFVDEVGAKLAPVLKPVVDHMTDWVTANRDWVSTKITDEVHHLADWIKTVDWDHVGEEIKGWAKSAREFSHDIGGAETAVELLSAAIAVNAGVSVFGKMAEIYKISGAIGGVAVKLTSELVPAWVAVGEAATGAATAEDLALGKLGVAKGIWAGLAVAGTLAVGGYEAEKTSRRATLDFDKSRGLTDDQAAANYVAGQIGFGGFLADPLGHEVIPDKPDSGPVHGGWGGDIYSWVAKHAFGESVKPIAGGISLPFLDSLVGFGDSPTDGNNMVPVRPAPISPGIPVLSPAPAGPSRVELAGKADVTITVLGLPPGSTAVATASGALAKPTVQLGQTFGDHYPRK